MRTVLLEESSGIPFSVVCEGDGGENLICRVEKLSGNGPETFQVTVRCGGNGAFCGVVRTVKTPGRRNLSDPYFMMPGFFYNNRNPNLSGPAYDPDCKTPHDMISGWWDFAAHRGAMPMICIREADYAEAFAADPHYEFSGECVSDDPEPQCGVGFSRDELRINIPAVEAPFAYTGLSESSPVLRKIHLSPRAEIRIKIYIFRSEAEGSGYGRFIRTFSLMMKEKYPAAEMPDPAEILDSAAEGIHAHYHPDRYFIYCRPYFPVIEQIANMRNKGSSEWHQMNTGFVNGFPACLALFRAGKYTEEAEAVADRICLEGISPSGLFYADFMPKTIRSENGEFANPIFGRNRRSEWGGGWLPDQNWLHSRTISDACLSLAEMLKFKPEKDLWRSALRGNLERILAMQLENGSFGQYYHAQEGKIVREDGCGGLLWIPVLLKAGELFPGDEAFREKAVRAAEKAGHAYEQYVLSDNIWGAPEDNNSPTSEDGMNAVIAYAALYRNNPIDHWLKLWRHAADWMLSFRKAYNVIMPPKSLIGIYGMRSRGGDFASASNNHLHVFEVLCIPELKELSEITGDPWYGDLADENFAFACQYLAVQQGEFGGFRGAMAEQFYWNEWNSLGRTWKKAPFYAQKGSATLFTAVWCNMVIASAAAWYLSRNNPEKRQ